MPTSSPEKYNAAGLCFPPQPGPCSLKALALQGGQAETLSQLPKHAEAWAQERGGRNNYFSFLAIKNDRSSMPLPLLPGPKNKSNLIVNILILKNTCRSDRLPTGKPSAISTDSTAAEQWVHYFKLLSQVTEKEKNRSSVCVNKGYGVQTREGANDNSGKPGTNGKSV